MLTEPTRFPSSPKGWKSTRTSCQYESPEAESLRNRLHRFLSRQVLKAKKVSNPKVVKTDLNSSKFSIYQKKFWSFSKHDFSVSKFWNSSSKILKSSTASFLKSSKSRENRLQILSIRRTRVKIPKLMWTSQDPKNLI